MKKQTILKIVTFITLFAIIFSSMFITAYAAEVEEDEQEYVWIDIEFKNIPRYNQRAYNTPYGNYGTVSSHGCGIVCVAMIASYMQDKFYDPVRMAEMFGDYNTKNGSLWILFQDSAEKLGLNFVKSDSPNGEWYDWDKVVEALKKGQPVICLQTKGIFTGSGHYIVLTGITEDGKIMVNDPNGYNWTKSEAMTQCYNTGFTEAQIREGAVCYWIYGAKEVKQESIADIFARLISESKIRRSMDPNTNG